MNHFLGTYALVDVVAGYIDDLLTAVTAVSLFTFAFSETLR
jgi:hypothetical protein